MKICILLVSILLFSCSVEEIEDFSDQCTLFDNTDICKDNKCIFLKKSKDSLTIDLIKPILLDWIKEKHPTAFMYFPKTLTKKDHNIFYGLPNVEDYENRNYMNFMAISINAEILNECENKLKIHEGFHSSGLMVWDASLIQKNDSIFLMPKMSPQWFNP